MHSIRLNINNKIYDNLMWLLKRFNAHELEIIDETDQFESLKAYLHSELKSIESGKAEFLDIEQLELALEESLKKHEG